MMTGDDVEARLVEAWRVFWRLEGNGHRFATDGPWHLMVRSASDRFAAEREQLAMGQTLDRLRFNPRPDRDMIDRAEAAARWLALIPLNRVYVPLTDIPPVMRPVTRDLVRDVTAEIARTGRAPDWLRVGGPGFAGSLDAKRMRYRRALDALAKLVANDERAMGRAA